MYGFSRAIYRELAAEIIVDRHCEKPFANHERVLQACEEAVERLATDRHYFARPTKSLFGQIRWCFPLASQPRVLRVVEHYLALADEFVTRLPAGLDANGDPLQCRANTRKGTPCQRVPLPHNGYCPSHQHLADTEDVERDRVPIAA
jgi:hypothetical protein